MLAIRHATHKPCLRRPVVYTASGVSRGRNDARSQEILARDGNACAVCDRRFRNGIVHLRFGNSRALSRSLVSGPSVIRCRHPPSARLCPLLLGNLPAVQYGTVVLTMTMTRLL